MCKDKPKAAMWLLFRPKTFSASGKNTRSSASACAVYRLTHSSNFTMSQGASCPLETFFKAGSKSAHSFSRVRWSFTKF